MNPRQRMLATLNREKPDVVPIFVSWRKEIAEELIKHYDVESEGDVLKILNADMARVIGVNVRWPRFDEKADGEITGDFGSSGRAIIHDERTFENAWGVVERVGRNGKYLEWVGGPFVATDDLDSFPWPTEDDVIEEADLAARVAEYKVRGYWVLGGGGMHPFKQAWHMRGFENFLCDYMANPEWVEAIYDRLVDFNVMINRRLAAAGVDQIDYWGDVAMQDRMMVPPDTWRRLDKPAWRRIIEGTREVNPDVRFFFHSDGDVTEIIDDIIEVGFDILNPLQPECVNPAIIKQKWGDRVCLDGGGSVQRTMPFGSVEDVQREVEFLLTHCAYNGGYCLRPSNVINFDTPIENVVAFYETARDFDLSALSGPPETIIDPPPCMAIEADVSAGGMSDDGLPL